MAAKHGLPIIKPAPGGITVFHYDLDGLLLAKTTGAGSLIRVYFWTEDTPIAQMDTELTYLHADHLNTPRIGTSSGTIVWQWNSDAFGSLLPNEDPDGDGTATTVNLRFPGQYFDKETNLHYNYFRDYDPRIGRYLESDPIGLMGGLNTFGYVKQNPLRFVDPLGQNPLAGTLVGASIGTTFGPAGTIIGGIAGAGVGTWIGWNATKPIFIKPPENAYDPNGPKAPGKPTEADGFKDPNGGEKWVPNPNPGKGGSKWGWEDANGDVWCPTGRGSKAHGGPHWDVQTPGGGYINIFPKG